MTTKYVRRSSATSVEFDAAAVMIASLNNLSSFDNAMDVSHRAFFFTSLSQQDKGSIRAGIPNLVEMCGKSAEFEDGMLL